MGKEIVYGFAESPFGPIVVARTKDGVCDLQFLGFNRMGVIHELAMHWGVYTPTTQDDDMAKRIEHTVFEENNRNIDLDLKGTEFQIKVWKELLTIPLGKTISYQELAGRLSNPNAVRAVATAVAQNPIAVIIPCHRIIHKDGTLGEYHWGSEIKRQLLDWEKNKLADK